MNMENVLFIALNLRLCCAGPEELGHHTNTRILPMKVNYLSRFNMALPILSPT